MHVQNTYLKKLLNIKKNAPKIKMDNKWNTELN